MEKIVKTETIKKIIYWLPRALSILFIAFIGMFALDVLGQPQWFLALLIHLIPNYILIILLIIAWKKEQIGGWLFIVIGILFLISSHFESWLISIPVIVIGALFASRKYLVR